MVHQLRRLALLAVVMFGASATPQTAEAGNVVYVAGSGGEFGTINLLTGAFSSLGTISLDTGQTIFGMGFGSNGNLYAVDSGSDAHLFQINITNGASTDLGALGISAIGAGADASGKLYVIDQSLSSANVYTLQPPATTTTLLGSSGYESDGLLAVNTNGSQIFTSLVPTSGTTDDTGTIDPLTGVATNLGSSGFTLFSGLFVGNSLYAFTGTNQIVTLNTTTGAGTEVATYDIGGTEGLDTIDAAALAPASVPEPSSLILGLIAAVALGATLKPIKGRPSGTLSETLGAESAGLLAGAAYILKRDLRRRLSI